MSNVCDNAVSDLFPLRAQTETSSNTTVVHVAPKYEL